MMRHPIRSAPRRSRGAGRRICRRAPAGCRRTALVFHPRLIVPAARPDPTLELPRRDATASNVVHPPGAASKPQGDLAPCDAPREDASALLDLRETALDQQGGIAVEAEAVDVSLSAGARYRGLCPYDNRVPRETMASPLRTEKGASPCPKQSSWLA
jgi:hypothetical protein